MLQAAERISPLVTLPCRVVHLLKEVSSRRLLRNAIRPEKGRTRGGQICKGFFIGVIIKSTSCTGVQSGRPDYWPMTISCGQWYHVIFELFYPMILIMKSWRQELIHHFRLTLNIIYVHGKIYGIQTRTEFRGCGALTQTFRHNYVQHSRPVR